MRAENENTIPMNTVGFAGVQPHGVSSTQHQAPMNYGPPMGAAPMPG